MSPSSWLTVSNSRPGRDAPEEGSADFVLGCDGAFSTVRKAMMRKPRFNFSQEYIPSYYLELCIPPTEDGEVRTIAQQPFCSVIASAGGHEYS